MSDEGTEDASGKTNKQPVTLHVKDMKPGITYTAANKFIQQLSDLDKYTVLALDPGIHNTYAAANFPIGKKGEDVRDTAMMLRSVAFRNRTKSKYFGDKMKKWHDEELGTIQQQLNTTPYRKSSSSTLYGQYVDNVYKHWDALWDFYSQRKIRENRFRAFTIYQKHLNRVVEKLCKPREGDKQTIILFGNAAKTNIFGRIKNNVKGPAKCIYNRIIQRKLAIVIWVDEFRTSKLDIYGQPLVHPAETRPWRIKKRWCNSEEHGPNVVGCRCHFKMPHRRNGKTTFKFRSGNGTRTV